MNTLLKKKRKMELVKAEIETLNVVLKNAQKNRLLEKKWSNKISKKIK
tara:strand:- start:199 stop:342 length:144 start_codon:yes stop_codon:yes gene_type:complete